MNIVPSELEKYSRKVATEFYVEVDPIDKEVFFRCVRGAYEMRGSTAIYISGKEMLDILDLNNILGNEGEVKKLLKNVDQSTDKKIHDVIYELLAKYIDQMLAASVGKDFYPTIKALEQHHKTYFWRS